MLSTAQLPHALALMDWMQKRQLCGPDAAIVALGVFSSLSQADPANAAMAARGAHAVAALLERLAPELAPQDLADIHTPDGSRSLADFPPEVLGQIQAVNRLSRRFFSEAESQGFDITANALLTAYLNLVGSRRTAVPMAVEALSRMLEEVRRLAPH